MEDIVIRKVTLNDIELLQQIGKQTFAETFAAHNSEENMAAYVATGFSREQLTAEVLDAHATFYFAVLDNQVVGYLKLNTGPSQTELQDKQALEIERIYVLQAFQGKKIGQLLYDQAIQVARLQNASYVWLGVWEENTKAIHFYRKNGFEPFDKHIFKLGEDEQTDIMMKKALKPVGNNISMQPALENEKVKLCPLQEGDFDSLYALASNPKVWEQHPNKNRWQQEVFRTFFEGALQSKGAFAIVDKATGAVIGSTRFYDYNEQDSSIFIGYTFYGTQYWGKGLNQMVKGMMLEYIFSFVSKVYFHIGANNIRSQIAVGRTGGTKIAEEEVVYFGEPARLNFLYVIHKENWNPVHA